MSPAKTRRSSVAQQHSPSALRFYEDEFVFDAVSGMFYRLNPTACFVLRALDEGVTPDRLPGMLQAEYGLDAATASRDVELFLNDLASLEPLSHLHPDNRAPR